MSLTDDEADDSEFREVSETNFQRVYNRVSKVGYADGVNDGREKMFQEGFDQGYTDGLHTGLEMAKYAAFCRVIDGTKDKPELLQKEAKLYEEMQIPAAKDKEHFKLLSHMDEPLANITKAQSDYVCEFLENTAKHLPQSTQLLATNTT